MKRFLKLLLVFALFSAALACIGGSLDPFDPNGNGDDDYDNGRDPADYDPDYSDDEYPEPTTPGPPSTEAPETDGTEEPSRESTTPDDSDLEKEIDDLKDQVDDNRQWVELIPCIFLTCNFEKGSMCMYRNLGPPAGPRKDGPSGPLAGTHEGQPSQQDYSEVEDIIDLVSAAEEAAADEGFEVDDTDTGIDDGDAPEEGGPDYGFNPDGKRVRKLKMKLRKKRLPVSAYAWQTVTGRFGNRVTGIRQAPEGSYYSAAYIRPNQQAAFEARVLRLSEDVKIEFQAYEGVSGLQLQVCCETREPKQIVTCGFQSENLFGPMGYHEWNPVVATCPAGTERILFICESMGKHQGACAVDNIRVSEEQCPQLTAKANLANTRRSKHRKRRRQ